MTADAGLKTQVCVRVRPRRGTETEKPVSYVKGQYPHYEFDAIFDEASSQSDVFTSIEPLVAAMEHGIHGLLLVHGAVGSGKSHTLCGPRGWTVGSPTQGLIPRAAAALFRLFARLPHEHFVLKASYSALTAGSDGGFCFDLLVPGAGPLAMKDVRTMTALENLTTFRIESPADVQEVLRVGSAALALATDRDRNLKSDKRIGCRPEEGLHTELTLHLERRATAGEAPTSPLARLTFVELAALDSKDPAGVKLGPTVARARSTGMQTLGASLRAVHDLAGRSSLRSSASSLSDVLPRREFSHIPWRDASLTMWLKEKLFMVGHAIVLSCIHGSSEHAQDTIASLAWSARLRPAVNGRGVVVTPTWGDANTTSRQLLTLDEFGYVPSKGLGQTLVSGSAAKAGKQGLLEAPGSAHRYGSPIRDRVSSDYAGNVSFAASPGGAGAVVGEELDFSNLSLGGTTLARVAELDLDKVSEVLDLLRQSNLAPAKVLRAQAVLQRMAETVGDLRKSLATSKGESKGLRKQLHEVVLRLENNTERSGDAAFMIETLKAEKDRLMNEHSAALDAALAEMEQVRAHVRTAEREKAALHESLQSDRRAREAADRASQESKRALAAAEAARREVERERDHLRAQNDNQREEATRAAQEVETLRTRIWEMQESLAREHSEAERTATLLVEASSSLRITRGEAEKVPSLETQVQDVLSQLRQLKASLETTRAEKRRLEGARKDAEDMLAATTEKYEHKLRLAEEEASRLRGSIESLAGKLQKEEAKCDGLELAMDRAATEHSERVASLRGDLEAVRSTLAAREEDLRRVRAHNDSIEARLTSAIARGEELESQLDATAARARALSRSLEELEVQKAHVDSDLDGARAQIQALNATKADLGLKVSELERDLASESTRLRESRAEARHEASMRFEAETRATDLSEELRDTMARLAATDTRLSATEATLATTESDLEKRSAALEETQASLTRLSAEARSLSERLKSCQTELESTRLELASTTGRLESKTVEAAHAKEARATLERESSESLAALEEERHSLEERLRSHRRLLTELALLLSVDGVGVSSDFASPVVAEMVARACRDVTSRARALGHTGVARGTPGSLASSTTLEIVHAPSRDLQRMLEDQTAELARMARDVDAWRSKCHSAQRRVASLESELQAARHGGSDETLVLRRRLEEEERRVHALEAQLRAAEALTVRQGGADFHHGHEGDAARAKSPLRAAAARENRALQEQLEGVRRERDRLQEMATRHAREAAEVRAQLERQRLDTVSTAAQLRASSADLERAMEEKAEAVRQRIQAEGALQRDRLDHIVENSRVRAAASFSPSPRRGERSGMVTPTMGLDGSNRSTRFPGSPSMF